MDRRVAHAAYVRIAGCGPCKQLTPKLEALVTGSNGALRLAKVNVDNLPELAQALQVQSLPTVMLLHGGKLVDQFKGVLPDPQLQQFIDKAVALAGGPNVGPKALEEAAALLESGDLGGATSAYAELLALPELAASARAGLALCALKDDNLSMAQDMIAEIHKAHPEDLSKPDVRKAISTVALAADAPGDDDGGESMADLRALLEEEKPGAWKHDVRFSLAQKLLGGGDHGAAIDELLRIIRRDKTWNEDAAKELIFKIFDSLGADHELTIKGRRKLANIVLM
jgi:putative thioredoxin